MASTDKWYWCFEHQRAEHEGDQCRATDRLGPYPSEEAARNWQATKEARRGDVEGAGRGMGGRTGRPVRPGRRTRS